MRGPLLPTTYRPSIPAAFEQAILKMLAKRPEERFQTPAELLECLGRIAKAGRVEAVRAAFAASSLQRCASVADKVTNQRFGTKAATEDTEGTEKIGPCRIARKQTASQASLKICQMSHSLWAL